MAKKPKPPPAATAEAKSPEAKPAWDAFERGDHRTARREAKALLAGNAPEAAKAEARDILKRTNLEPGVLVALLALGVVIAGIVALLASR